MLEFSLVSLVPPGGSEGNASAVLRKQISKCPLRRLKKKQKRSASSSPSSSSARSSSSSSSSSSSRRRSKKKKKRKQKKSEQASRRHRRVSSRESRRSEEDKNRKDGKEEEEEEWYPAPSDTSATFLNRKEGPGFQEEVEERRSSQLYSPSAASDEDGSDSLDRGRKRRDKEQERRSSRKSWSRSPEKGERANRGKEENRKDSRRSSIDENAKRRTSCSSAEAENSRKVNLNWLEGRRNSSEGGRYKNSGWQEHPDSERVEKDGRKERAETDSSRSEAGSSSRSEGPGGSWTSAGRPRKDLPSNLLDIFSQIAQFEKEKGIKPK